MAHTRKALPTKKSSIPGVSFIRGMGGIKEYQLKKNELRILLAQDKSVPVAGCMVTYHVGSRNEATGYTGATHLLEHLMFKGSEKFNKENGRFMDRLFESRGSIINATTWFDRTNYFEIVPKDVVPLAIEVEADRMRTARFTEADKTTEMPIVRSEYEMNENQPLEALDKQIWATAFVAHPYHHPTIGWLSDIENVSIGRLKQFYDDFYWPNNATVTITGNFDEMEVLALIKKYFGVHPPAPRPFPALYTEEPLQQGQRRVIVKRAGAPMICVAHKIPSALNEDMPALLMLATILYDDKSTRLYKRFVDSALATNVLVQANPLKDPSLFQAFVTLAPDTSHDRAEKILLQEYDDLIEKGVTAAELRRAKRAWRVYWSKRLDGPWAVLEGLNEDIGRGDWTRFVTLPAAVDRVSATDIRRVAKKYLVEDQSTVGWFVPTNI
ncbi:MAG TPA: pitrilysin family protein [Candidatus Paceibacterota bacterium]|jgi:zinc protease